MYTNYEAWWIEQSCKGDPSRNPHLARDAFNAGRADYATTHRALTLEVQQHRRCHAEVMRLAERLRKYEPGHPMVLNAAQVQACRPEDCAMLATPAGAEMLAKAVASMQDETPNDALERPVPGSARSEG